MPSAGMNRLALIGIVVVIIAIVVASGLYLAYNGAASTTSSLATSNTNTSTASSFSTSSSAAVSAPSSNSPINIGLMEDTTGPIAGFAAETVADAQIAVNQINTAGGVNGRPIKLFIANSNPDPVTAAQSLVLQDNVSMLFGISYCGEQTAIQSFASSHKIVVINTSCGVDTFQNNVTTDYNDYKYFFRLAQLNSQYASSLFDFFGNTTKPASIYFVAEDLSFTHYTFGLINQTAQQMGIKVLGATFVSLSQTDFTTVATTVAAAHPSVVIDGQTGIGGSTFYTQFKADPNSKGTQFVFFSDGALDDPYAHLSCCLHENK
ncbi:MAG: ABC transporter substrate-binding protein [Nitrososphaerales archaeon]